MGQPTAHLLKTYKNYRKTFNFDGLAAIRDVRREFFSVIFLCWACCGGCWGSLWRLWGAITLLGAALGGHLAPKGSPWTIFGSITPRDLAEGNQVWRLRGRVGKGFLVVRTAHSPLAENIQKPKENLQFSWFGGYQGCMLGAFYILFSPNKRSLKGFLPSS